MTKSTIALLAVLLFAFPLAAQEKPEAPKPNRRVFIVGVVSLAAAKTYDAVSTQNLLNRGGWENDPLFGNHPSPGRLAATNAVIFVGQVAAFHFAERSPHKWLRWSGRAFLAVTIADHVRAGACNASIDPRSPVRQSCAPF